MSHTDKSTVDIDDAKVTLETRWQRYLDRCYLERFQATRDKITAPDKSKPLT